MTQSPAVRDLIQACRNTLSRVCMPKDEGYDGIGLLKLRAALGSVEAELPPVPGDLNWRKDGTYGTPDQAQAPAYKFVNDHGFLPYDIMHADGSTTPRQRAEGIGFKAGGDVPEQGFFASENNARLRKLLAEERKAIDELEERVKTTERERDGITQQLMSQIQTQEQLNRACENRERKAIDALEERLRHCQEKIASQASWVNHERVRAAAAESMVQQLLERATALKNATDVCFLCGQPGATKSDTHDRLMHDAAKGGCPPTSTVANKLEQCQKDRDALQRDLNAIKQELVKAGIPAMVIRAIDGAHECKTTLEMVQEIADMVAERGRIIRHDVTEANELLQSILSKAGAPEHMGIKNKVKWLVSERDRLVDSAIEVTRQRDSLHAQMQQLEIAPSPPGSLGDKQALALRMAEARIARMDEFALIIKEAVLKFYDESIKA